MSAPTMTQEQCFANASRILARGLLKVLNSDPREAALRAHREHGPSVDELETRIREMQAGAPRKAAA